MSTETIWLRFFAMANLSWVVDWALGVDYADRFGVVVEAGLDRRIIVHAAHSRTDAARADVAFPVADASHGGSVDRLVVHRDERCGSAPDAPRAHPSGIASANGDAASQPR